MKLSIAMIVKDEEANLPRCFDSIKGLMEMGTQVVVVDTGSTDRTKEICKEYGVELYEHPWERNFGKHRNQSFSYAKGDWILQLDADETMDFKGRHPSILFQTLEKIPKQFNAGAFIMTDWRQGSPHAETHAVRIFRRGKVRYKRRIHNEPVYKNEAVIFSNVFMNHYGYDLTEQQMKKKAARTISILEEELADNPNDYDSMFYLAQAYGSWLKDYDQCMKYAELYYSCKDKIQKKNPLKFNTSIFYLIASIHFNKERFEDCYKWIQISLKEIPGDLDMCHLIMQLGHKVNNKTMVSLGARGFVNAYDSYEKNRAKKGARFTFYHKTSALVSALYILSTTYFELAKSNTDRMFNILNDPELDKEFKANFREGFLEFCKQTGIAYETNSVSINPNTMSQPSQIITPKHKINPEAIRKFI